MSKNYDCIVIGAGNGGLCAAAYASKNGLKTLLVEQHNLPGGCATSFKRGRFEFEAALHELCEFGPAENPGSIREIFDELDLDVTMRPIEDCFRATCPGFEGVEPYDIVMPNGRKAFIQTLEGVSPGSEEPMRKFFDLCDEADRFIKYMTITDGDPDPTILKQEFITFMPYVTKSVDDVLDELNFPLKARSILSTY